MNINEWAAKECYEDERFSEVMAFKITGLTDVPKEALVGRYTFFADGKWIEWNIKDPRCREIVREHFNMQTMWGDVEDWESMASHDDFGNFSADGKTIAEAEIAAIEEIYAEVDGE